MLEDEQPLFISHHHVWIFSIAHIRRQHLCAYAGVIIDQLRNKFDGFSWHARRLEPIEDGGESIGLGVAPGFAMSPETFTRDEVLHAVFVHVHERQSMWLGELYTVRVFAGV